MISSKRIAIFYSYNPDWIGGVYYLQNLVKALNFLPSNEQPTLVVFSEKIEDFTTFQQETTYPKLEFRQLSGARVSLTDNLFYKLFRVTPKFFRDIDKFYLTNTSYITKFINPNKTIYWLGDLQNRFYPQYFDNKSLAKRLAFQDYLSEDRTIVATSVDMKEAYLNLYPTKKYSIHVLRFASILPDISYLNAEAILKKYGLDANRYFFTPNQFWAHKNHTIIIKAASLLNDQGKIDVPFIFSGKEYDRRNPTYTQDIKNQIAEANLTSNFSFLGFIPREEQLVVMSKARAILQPSFYEGWSTVIEDAKALGKPVICSDIAVHREQLGSKGVYFDPNNEVQLFEILSTYTPNESINYNYHNSIMDSANMFISIFSKDA